MNSVVTSSVITGRHGPVFLVGAPRSGTTLLQYMLRSHPSISMPTGESHFFIPLYRNVQHYGDLSKLENVERVLKDMYRMSAEFLDTDLHGMKFDIHEVAVELHGKGCNTMPSIISGIFSKNAKGEGKQRWGDKTPYYILHVDKLLDWFPDAQIVHIVRDGRDCALSLFDREHDFGVYNIYHAAKYWQQYVDAGDDFKEKLNHDVYMEIRYEDILENQIESIKTICEFLGVGFSEDVINFKKSSGEGKTPLLQKPVQKDNMEKWRRKMSPWQIRVFESAAGDTLSRHGYALSTRPVHLPLPIRAFYRLHNKLLTWYYSRFY